MPPVQQKIKDIALKEVMKKTNNQLSIGKIKLRPFNSLILEDVYSSDMGGDTLLYISDLSASFSLSELLQNRLLIHSVELNDFNIHITKDSLNGDFNFQFFIDAFASADTLPKENKEGLIIQIDDISLSKGRLSYDILSEEHVDSLMDFNHLYVTDLVADINLNSIDIEKLDAAVHSLSFKERSGFELKDLKLKVKSDKQKINLSDFLIQLPNSELIAKDSYIDYSGMDISQLAEKASYHLNLKTEKLYPKDLQYFYLPLKEASGILALDAVISGTLPEINIQKLIIDYDSHINLDLVASLENYLSWETSKLQLDVKNISSDTYGIHQILDLSGNSQTDLPLSQSEKIVLQGQLSGSLPDFVVDLRAETQGGQIVLKGNGGYDYESSDARFDVILQSAGFNLKTIMGYNSAFGILNTRITAKGKVTGNGKINADAVVGINRFDYNNYPFKNINADIKYINDSIALSVVSRDSNLLANLSGYYNMRPKFPVAGVQMDINHIDLKQINLISDIDSTVISGLVFAEVNGIDPENMNAKVNIDSLFYITDKGQLYEHNIIMEYNAGPLSKKSLNIRSSILDAVLDGQFKITHLSDAMNNTLSFYLPALFPVSKNKKAENSYFDLAADIQSLETLTTVLDLPFTLKAPAQIICSYQEQNNKIALTGTLNEANISDFSIENLYVNLNADSLNNRLDLDVKAKSVYGSSDSLTAELQANLLAGKLGLDFHFVNNAPSLLVDGNIAADITMAQKEKQQIPDLLIRLRPTDINLNENIFKLDSALISMQDKKYNIRNFRFWLSEQEYLKIDGDISTLPEDTLSVDFSKVQLGTITEALRMNIPISGEANGLILGNRLLDSPRIFTRNFGISDIAFDRKPVGSLSVRSAWRDDIQGVFLNAVLSQVNDHTSTVSGYFLPAKDSLGVRADIQSLQLDWISSFTDDFLFGLGGELGANIRVVGRMSNPEIQGSVRLNDGTFGLKMTNVTYSISDSISITPTSVGFKDFAIVDQRNKRAVINGDIRHSGFSSIRPKMHITFNDFMVVNNPEHTDSLFYGNLNINGTADITGSDKEILLNMSLRNSGNAKVFFKMPEEEVQARRYTSITFINPGDSIDTINKIFESKDTISTALDIPIKMQIDLSVDSKLTLGTMINPQTKDEASVNGAGNINFSYDMKGGNMDLRGTYTINDGQCSISLQNITRKTFKVQPGGKVMFNGDPMATSFDITAIYPQRADLTTLDQAFARESSLGSTKVLVNSLIHVIGNIDHMDISYDIELPNNSENVQRKVDALLYSDEIKIKEIAYLLALGTFTPVNPSDGTDSGNSIWTSLASSSLTTQLNNILSGVMSDNWSIGTDLRTTDNDMSNLEMDVNISTRLFNDRLTLSSNLGYHNSSTENTNFTGDFEAGYKLTKSGDIVLKMYNVTNDRFYDQVKAPTTQGVGVVYKKESKTFWDLFGKLKKLFGK